MNFKSNQIQIENAFLNIKRDRILSESSVTMGTLLEEDELRIKQQNLPCIQNGETRLIQADINKIVIKRDRSYSNFTNVSNFSNNSIFSKNFSTNSEIKKISCTCKNSQCLKMYCECFSALSYCDPSKCSCRGCNNNKENDVLIYKIISSLLGKQLLKTTYQKAQIRLKKFILYLC